VATLQLQSVQKRMNTSTENSCNLYSGYHNIHPFLQLLFSNGDCNDEHRMWGEKVTNMNPDHILSLPDLNAVPCTTAHDKNPLSNCIKLFLVNYIFLLHQGSHSTSRDFVIHTNKPGNRSASIVKTGAFSNSEICTGSI